MAATRVEFINLEKAREVLPRAVARLAAFHWRAGKKVLVLAGDGDQARALDEALWTFDPASFVPHALVGGEDQDKEPVLIGPAEKAPNGAQVLIMARPLENPPLADYQLVIDFVPAEAGPPLDAARARYKAMSGRPGVDLAHITELP